MLRRDWLKLVGGVITLHNDDFRELFPIAVTKAIVNNVMHTCSLDIIEKVA